MPVASCPEGTDRPHEWTAGVDWIRLRVEGASEVRTAWNAAREIQRMDEKNGEKVRPWKWQGYEGKASPRIRWGRKGRAMFWEASGGWADSTLGRMPSCGGRCTRIDLQSTVRFSRPQLQFGMSSLPREAMTHPRRLRSGIPVGLLQGADGMWLGTVGRRTSGEYFRLYDKGVETRDHRAGIRWRLELEAKYQHAEALWAEAQEQVKDPNWCARYVTSRWLSLGCTFPSPPVGDTLGAVRPEPRPTPSYVQLLRWMESSVAPAVARTLHNCTVTEVLTALGLSGVAVARDDTASNGS